MPTLERLIYCQCCGRDKPHWDYAPGSEICTLCNTLTPSEAVLLTRASVRRENIVHTQTAAGRKLARLQKKLEIYKQVGKRCSACWQPKPPSAYNCCAPAPDGLQPICRECNQIQVAARKAGGKYAWHAIQAALRAMPGAIPAKEKPGK